jgi:hypothetical protein
LACHVLTSLLCAQFLPANRAFENRKSGFTTRFGQDLANEARQMVKWQNSHGARFSKTAANCYNSFCHFHLILSVNIGLDQRHLIYHPGQF